jgi:F0F1-type ATP synthase alpha subunit
MYQKLDTTHISLAEEIKKQKDLTPEIENSIKKLISEILKECGFN